MKKRLLICWLMICVTAGAQAAYVGDANQSNSLDLEDVTLLLGAGYSGQAWSVLEVLCGLHPPLEIVEAASGSSAALFAQQGEKYLGTAYQVMDCQAFVERMLSDAGVEMNLAGSNAWFRQMTWAGTPEECVRLFGEVPVGAFLFILEQNGKEPEKYRADGIGNASHIGVKTGQDLGAIHASYTRSCVAHSAFSDETISGSWNMVGLWSALDYGPVVNAFLQAQ